jgi:hypothetical protein
MAYSYPEAKKIPRSYIYCTEFKDFHFIAQKAKLQLGWDYHELKTGYDVMVTVPNELVQILQELEISKNSIIRLITKLYLLNLKISQSLRLITNRYNTVHLYMSNLFITCDIINIIHNCLRQ